VSFLPVNPQQFNPQQSEELLNVGTRLLWQQNGEVNGPLRQMCESVVVELTDSLTNLGPT
jgi:hypothetical protein